MKYFASALLLSSVIMLSCKQKFESTTVLQKPISESVYASGVVEAVGQYQIIPLVSGTILDLKVKPGDAVSKGQTILTIDDNGTQIMEENAELDAAYNDYNANQSRIKEMEINIQSAKSQVDYNRSMYDRAKNLYEKDAGTRVEMDNRKLALDNAVNQYNAAQLQLTNFKKQLALASQKTKNVVKINRNQTNEYIIQSKIKGKVYELFKEKGELVSPQTPVGVIGDDDEFIIKLQVDQRDIVKVQPGQEIYLTIESDKEKVYEGKVTSIIPYMNDRSKTFTVEAVFTKAPVTLFPNLTLEANILISSKENALIIPRKFLHKGDSVLLANDKKVKVKTGLMDFQNVEILEGLKAGDEIKILSN